MPDQISSTSESSDQAPINISDGDAVKGGSGQPYQLTVKRGFLALLMMYACQTLVGLGFAYGVKFFQGANAGASTVDIKMIGMVSVLIGGAVVLLWVWIDLRRLGPSFLPQIGLQQCEIKTSQALMLVVLVCSATHFLAWIYRSIILPLVDQGGIVGGGSQMFAHIQENGSPLGMTGFLILALIIGPVMEEVIFRGYLQSALARQMPHWAAISITSLLFMAGHGPMILWPIYFVYSVAWGWIFMITKSLKMSIAVHMLSNLFYTVVAVMGWKLLA